MPEQVHTKNETKICLICHKAVAAEHAKCPDDGGELVNTKQDKLIGEVFANRYKILSVIGQGGMSTVYKAQHTYMDRVVAVKLLHNHLVSDPISVQRFQQEAKAAASLSHANIITVFDFGVTEDGLAFLVMDYLEGPSLGDLLDRTGSVPPEEALDIFRQVLKGLCHAHRKGVIHRDLKPRNLVLAVDEDGTVQVKIVDFGIAKIVPQDGGESQHLTQTGEVFGSPIYMSPEQCSGQPLDLRSDIYSLGCVMFEVLVGAPPFLGQNAVETMSMHVNDDPPPFKQIDAQANIPKDLEDLILTCLEKSPKKRFQTTSAVLEALPLPNGVKRVSQTGTVVMRLEDMSTQSAQGLPAKGKTPRKTKRYKSRISSRLLATGFGIAYVMLIGLLTWYPFVTADDPGSPIQKMVWQFEIWLSDKFMQLKWPGIARSVLDEAVDAAYNMGGGRKSKNINYDIVITSLTKQAEASVASGDAAKQEEIVKELVELDRLRWQNRGRQLLGDISDAQKYVDQLKSQGQLIETRMGEPRLNWSGSVQRIVETARRLDATYAYSLEDEVLKQSEKLLKDLYGPFFVGLADINEQRADCLLNQDRVDEIGQQNLYQNIKNIREKHDELSRIDPGNDAQYIRAMLHLGQWQRDRSEFVGAEENLSKALKLAEKCKSITPDQLSEYYGSYADLLQQKKETAEAQSWRDRAADERKKAYEQCAMTGAAGSKKP
ncbi:MAG: serine/threonine-protein kinase [Candidatus Obscuribacterales bacterium]|nr:serine/threonine-protein kinase [Candidatus Obscuribacterales bacterium]